ncbi:hypothetical protein TKK_0017434 [Trichogramma kaykai]|uniref:Peptidase M12B domain-containing protein n=1 Tax=Trichogramma kaykai TaxID=54128 RepID=A0ABD2W4E8_9HYME
MGSCSQHRLAEVAAGLAFVLLAALLIVVWTGATGGSRPSSLPNATSSIHDNGSDLRVVPLRPQSEIAGKFSVASEWEDDVGGDGEHRWAHWKNDILPSNGSGESEYIVLAKANQNFYEDPMDEDSAEERHHSGHFRHSQSKVWDPHPQYEFQAFGRRFHLSLKEDSSFAPANVQVTHIDGENATRREYADHELGCFYTGSVKGDPKSIVAVSLCHGMTGHMRTASDNYLIKPMERWNSSDRHSAAPLRHVVYKLPKNPATTFPRSDNDLPDFDVLESGNATLSTTTTTAARECGLIENENSDEPRLNEMTPEEEQVDASDPMMEETSERSRRRRRRTSLQDSDTRSRATEEELARGRSEEDIYGLARSRRALTREYFIEIMVVADQKMIDYHGSSLTSYILVLMNTVSRIYKDPSIGNPISIAVIKIKQIKEIFGKRQRGSYGIGATEMLRTFCDWQKLNNPYEPSPEHHDAALLLTRENLCHNPGQKRCDTLGLAELGRMCSAGSSCAIVQDNGLATAFTIAHEIGHVLNMPHDDDPKCSRFRDRSGVHNIMSRMLDDNTVPWEWSKCSRHYVTEFLDAGQGNCLLDEPRDSKIMSSSYGNRLPGEDYSGDRQCELVYGSGSRICPHMVSDVCKRLWCTVPYWDTDRREHQPECHTQHMPWADGTRCEPGKWCHRGECVSRENLEPVDGQWGEWGPYGECSRPCGGGVMMKTRECDNPPSKNGGNYCVGERVHYRSCATKECPPGTIDFREEQCAAFDNDNRNIRNLAKNVKWHAKYTRIQPEDRCKLYCQVAGNQYYMLRDKVTDGTACGPDTFHMCINGRCEPAGCDHVLNSAARLDTCGVCGGDNSSCRRISGSYNVTEYGYTMVTKIPAGSSHIDIRQYGWQGSHNDSNYLALKLKDGRYILNGNFMVMHRKVIVQPGITIEYSGPEQVVERLNSSRPVQLDLILEVLSVGNVYPPQISYEYTVPKYLPERYAWIVREWTFCDRICQGTMHRRVVCQSVESREIVSDSYCPSDAKPQEESQACNTHCEIQWLEVSHSECSSLCGPGSQTVKYRCVQVPADRERHPRVSPRPVPNYVCNYIERPVERRACTGLCEQAHWRYGPWSACSVSCGDDGLQYRLAECVDADNRTLPEAKCLSESKIDRQSCGGKPCPKWAYGDWNPCSASCGPGKRERPYWCHVDNNVVPKIRCKDRLGEVSQACDAGPCPNWQTGDWSQCSVKCGEGIRRRMVACKYTNGTTGELCDNSKKPINTISCSLEACPTKTTFVPVTYSSSLPVDDLSQHENDVDSHRITFRSGYTWNIGGWEECSKPCGGGLAVQIVQCISVETNKIAPNQGYCDSKTRPASKIVCNQHQCPNWITGNWSQCDVKCGDGYQHRQILCQDLRGEIMNDSDCSEKTRPRHVRKCSRPACEPVLNSSTDVGKPVASYKWRAGSWGECSASCGNGYRRREVICHRINSFGWLDPAPVNGGCSEREKPPSQQPCRDRGCADPFYWVAGTWRKCSEPCGIKGRQIRRLFCLDRYNRKVRRRHCPVKLRPQRRRKCNQRPCTGPTTCIEVQNRLKTNVDGEYTLLVGGRYMSIYCSGMDSFEPLEYLTLPQGERENYAEIYDKRLLNPHTCPFEGVRNDSCECMNESVPISGRTMFQKIRINVHTLHIVGNDFKFARQIGLNNIDYGKAGDCYSQKNCPQGRFAINLSGTWLMIAPEVHWPKQKNTFSHIDKINNQRILGVCGGYCGFCSPSPSLKLNVLPT